jgi:hypothetical protein
MSTSIPENINPLSPNGFLFSIQKLPKLSYFAQQVSIPSINLPNIQANTPFSTIQIAGGLLTYEPLSIDFLVDENMANYLSISDWIVAMGFPENYQQYISWQNKDSLGLSELAKNYSDATLQILDSSNSVIQTVTFVDIIPTSLGNMSFLTTSTDVNYITCNVTFDYSYFHFN